MVIILIIIVSILQSASWVCPNLKEACGRTKPMD